MTNYQAQTIYHSERYDGAWQRSIGFRWSDEKMFTGLLASVSANVRELVYDSSDLLHVGTVEAVMQLLFRRGPA